VVGFCIHYNYIAEWVNTAIAQVGRTANNYTLRLLGRVANIAIANASPTLQK